MPKEGVEGDRLRWTKRVVVLLRWVCFLAFLAVLWLIGFPVDLPGLSRRMPPNHNPTPHSEATFPLWLHAWLLSLLPKEGLEGDRLRRAEHIVVLLRWVCFLAFLGVLWLTGFPVNLPDLSLWTALGLGYCVVTQWVVCSFSSVHRVSLVTSVADIVAVAALCFVTGAIRSPFVLFFSLCVIGAALRSGFIASCVEALFITPFLALLFWSTAGASRGELGTAVLYLFLFALFAGILASAEKHSRRQAIQAQQARRELLQRLISIQEEERKRIVGELHDRLGSAVHQILFGLERCRGFLPAAHSQITAELEALHRAARAHAGEVRRFFNEIRPPILDDCGFVEALKDYVARLQMEADLDITLKVDSLPEPLPADADLALFRIVQEALLNVRKHARARRVHIGFRQHDQRVVLSVQDDGCGFDPHARCPGHYGILYMRERAEYCGGQLEIRSQSGGGTQVWVSLPC
jgi:signal transduction histidine kinase